MRGGWGGVGVGNLALNLFIAFCVLYPETAGHTRTLETQFWVISCAGWSSEVSYLPHSSIGKSDTVTQCKLVRSGLNHAMIDFKCRLERQSCKITRFRRARCSTFAWQRRHRNISASRQTAASPESGVSGHYLRKI